MLSGALPDCKTPLTPRLLHQRGLAAAAAKPAAAATAAAFNVARCQAVSEEVVTDAAIGAVMRSGILPVMLPGMMARSGALRHAAPPPPPPPGSRLALFTSCGVGVSGNRAGGRRQARQPCNPTFTTSRAHGEPDAKIIHAPRELGTQRARGKLTTRASDTRARDTGARLGQVSE
jgi:hypothetical protein